MPGLGANERTVVRLLYATVRQRKIHVKNPVTVIRNGVGVDDLVLEMDDEWAALDRIVCVFELKHDEGTVTKEMLHTFGQTVQVPWECLVYTGLLSVSVTGYDGNGAKVMTTMAPDSFWTVVQNGTMSADASVAPTPDLYAQILAVTGQAQDAAAAADRIREQLLEDRDNGLFDGISPTVEIGTVTTTAPGGEAQVVNVGTAQNVKLNFVLPRGKTGDQGKQGVQGTPGIQGRPGGYYIPFLRGTDLDWSPSDPSMPSVGGVNWRVVGKDGKPGRDGAVYVPSIVDGVLDWSVLDPDPNIYYPVPLPANVVGPKGDKGVGITNISSTIIGNVAFAVITTDDNVYTIPFGIPRLLRELDDFPSTFDIPVGYALCIGDNNNFVWLPRNTGGGGSGEAGEDGGYYKPSVSSSGLLSWTASKSGMPSVASVNIKGADGKTPVRGTDYWTAADIAQIKGYVDEAILGGAW